LNSYTDQQLRGGPPPTSTTAGAAAALAIGKLYGCTPGALTSGAIDAFTSNVNAAKETTNQRIAQVKSNKYAQYQQYQRYLAYLAWVAEQERLLAEAYRQYNIMLGNLASAYMQNMAQAIQQQQKAAALSKAISSIKGAAYSAVGSMFGNSSWKVPAPADFHGILDVVGLIPVVGEPADLANGIWYMVEGDATNAQLSAIGVFPIVGWLGTGGKVISRVTKNAGEEAAEAGARGANGAARMTSKEATDAANLLGYQKTSELSHGQPVYSNPKGQPKYITPDVDSHSGGVWKGANTIEGLGSKTTRSGTYDDKLSRIGD
jgi:hypothetical protein